MNGKGGKSGRGEKAEDEPESVVHISYYNDGSERAVEGPADPPLNPHHSSVVVCPSYLPDSQTLQPFPSGASPSHSRSSLHPENDIPRPRAPSRSRIAYPTVAGHLSASRNTSRTSFAGGSSRAPSASGSRISLHDNSTRAHSPISVSASSRSASPSAQVALPIAQTPTPSHASASHVSLANPPVTHDDPLRITIRRDTGAPDGGAQGHDIELTTSPIQEGHSAVENLSIARSNLLERELRNEYPHFQPIIPESNNRYDGKATVPADPTEYPIEPLTTYFGRKVPEGWRELLHPEGARYFCYLEKNVYTDANILDDQVLSKIMSFITEIFDFCGMKLPPAAHLVLIPEIGESHSTCAYYCVDHSRRSIFWLDHFTFSDSDFNICRTVKGATDPSHIRHEIESQYWYHCNQYPHSFGLTPTLVDELRDVIIHWIGDSLTSMTGTAPYSVEDLQSMLSLVNSFRKNTSTGGCVSAYSRLMHIFCRHRFTYFHGQPAVRLDFDRSAHEAPDVPLQSWLLNLLSPLMFSTPDIYYNALDRIWVDRMIHQATWAKFINGMKDEWQELILFGTVLLNANVAFLAIQSIDIGPDGDPQRSPAQIGSYMSVVATLGSIILGLFLARKHRVKPKESAEDAAGFLNTWSPEERGRSEVRIGLETLAILYSVPYALLMWGVILFLVGFSYMCFNNANITLRSLTGGAWLVTFVFVLWCILSLTTWHQPGQGKSFWQSIFAFVRWVLFDLRKEIRLLNQKIYRGISSYSSQIQTDGMNGQSVESPVEMPEQDMDCSRSYSPSRSQQGHQNGGSMLKRLLSFLGRKRSSHDTEV